MACVLVVEDDPDVREFMQELLESSGYETMGAANGQEALDQLSKSRPCAILLDIHMPVMDGYQFRAQQLRDKTLADIPVLCITAAFDPAEVSANTGVPCLPKPFEFEELMRQVKAMCAVAS